VRRLTSPGFDHVGTPDLRYWLEWWSAPERRPTRAEAGRDRQADCAKLGLSRSKGLRRRQARGNNGNVRGSFGFGPVRVRRELPRNDADSMHCSARARTLPRLDKLGVTGSSPVPPIEKPRSGAFLLLQRTTIGKEGPCHRVRSNHASEAGMGRKAGACLISASREETANPSVAVWRSVLERRPAVGERVLACWRSPGRKKLVQRPSCGHAGTDGGQPSP